MSFLLYELRRRSGGKPPSFTASHALVYGFSFERSALIARVLNNCITAKADEEGGFNLINHDYEE
jgi:hypothetical protein